MNENQQFVCQKDFNDFREEFVKFEAKVEERQKSMDNKLDELLRARDEGREHDSTQAALITDLNQQMLSQGQQIGALRESRETMREQINKNEKTIEVIQAEKRMMNRFWAIISGVAIILSPIIAEYVGNFLTK